MATDLPPKRQRFVDEYLIDLNATQAAIRAGYSPRTANEQGSQLLAILSVRDAIDRAQAERSRRIGLHADRVLEELVAVGFAHMGQYATWGPRGVTLVDSETVDSRAVAEVKETTTQHGGSMGIKLHDKVATLKLLGQHIGLFVERHEISGPGGDAIEVRARDYREGLAPFLPPADDLDE
jgi:phage terminase small subunit